MVKIIRAFWIMVGLGEDRKILKKKSPAVYRSGKTTGKNVAR
jgi:hypothetical protein